MAQAPTMPAQPNFGRVAFVTTPASHANAVGLFHPTWVCELPDPALKSGGVMRFFTEDDPRPRSVVDAFGSIRGWKVLELGSFEGAHTYQLEKFGADPIIGIEANPDIFLRALVVKNALGMRATFLLGDFCTFLANCNDHYDLIFASGVLYHLADPAEALYQIASHTDRVFLWTHYVDTEKASRWQKTSTHSVRGVSCIYYRYDYPERASRAYGGVASYCSRLTLVDIIAMLKTFGLSNVKIIQDKLDHPGGPAVSLVGWRDGVTPR